MIFKKPYAFFIKNFKLFHFVMFALSAILLYRTSVLYNFANEYTKNVATTISIGLVENVFSSWNYVVSFFLILLNTLILVVMVRKEKPFVFYVVNIAFSAFIVLYYVYCFSIINKLQFGLVDSRVTLAMRDILNILRFVQVIATFVYVVRATGFNLKKFDFNRDLQELDIDVTDNEEFEVAIDFESNVIKRRWIKRLRKIKYYFLENKIFIVLTFATLVGLVCFFIYDNSGKYNKTYNQGEYFGVSGFTIAINDSYAVTRDYSNKSITDGTFSYLCVKASIKGTGSVNLQKLMVTIDDKNYYPINKNKKTFIDLGNVYVDEEISDKFNDYLFVYKIPNELMGKKFYFKYIDNVIYKNGRTIYETVNVEISKNYLNENKKTQNYNIADTILFDNEFLRDNTVKFDSMDIGYKFDGVYNNCVIDQECYEFKEVIIPSYSNNTTNVLLKLSGEFKYENRIKGINDFYDFLNLFGKINYVLDGKEYSTEIFEHSLFKKVKKDNEYYISVDSKIINASSISLVFTIRNSEYIYKLR